MKYFKVLFLSVLCLLSGISTLVAQNTTQGVLTGDFSVSATKKVRFSQGNLQYRASTNTWRFASNQYDFYTTDNEKASSTYNGWVDLFGFATSGWRAPGQTYKNYQPWHYTESVGTSESADKYAYLDADMTGANDSADWGVYNAISNGGGRKGLWRVLTKDEWNYLLNTRTNAAKLRFRVRIDNNTSDRMGYLIFPDGTNLSALTALGLNSSKSPVASSSSKQGNDITMATYNQCLALGAVYLPAAGLTRDQNHDDSPVYQRHSGCSRCSNPDGIYWTSTHATHTSNHSMWEGYRVWFWESTDYYGSDENTVDPYINANCSFHKHSVRLVREVYTVNFYDEDGRTLLKTETVLHGNYATAPANPTKHYDCYNYTFNGWNGGDVTKPITSNTNFVAKFKTNGKHSFTVKFYNWDGTLFDTKTGVKCGDAVTTTNTPTRPAQGNIIYTFSHWYKNGDQLKQPYSTFSYPDTIVRAEFTSKTIPYYTITWRSDDGTLIHQGQVAYDSMPAAPNPPVKPSTCLTKYTFLGWTPQVVPVKGAATYTAVYDTTDIYYTVRWLDWDGTPLDSVTNARCNTKPAYPGTEPSREPDDEYIYTFTGWAPADSTITGNTDFRAQYSTVDRYYNVSYITNIRSRSHLDDPSVRVRTERVEYKTTPNPIGTDSADFVTCSTYYKFDHWLATTPSLDTLSDVTITTPVTRSVYYIAQYSDSARTYKMTWVAKDTTIVNVQSYDSVLLVPTAPAVKDSIIDVAKDSIFVFTGWTPSLTWMPKNYLGQNTVPCGDTTFTANYKSIPLHYNVIVFYRDSLTDVVKSDTFRLVYGTPLNFDDLAKDRKYCDVSYQFDRWDPALETVTDQSIKVYNAIYNRSINYYNVTWNDWDGTLLSSGAYTYQQWVTECKHPTRPTTEDTVYFFTGWTPALELSMPCQDMTYTAQYRARANKFVDTLIVHGDTILDTVPYDSLPKKLERYGKDFSTCDSIYYFQNWTPAPAPQDTFGVTYDAIFFAVARDWSITWKDWNGSVIVTNGVHNGDAVVAPTDPTRQKDASNVYFFKDWNPTPAATVNCADQEYMAQYITKPRTYLDTIVLFDDTIYTPVEYGTTPNLNQYEALQYTKCDTVFTFNHWTPAVEIQDTVAVKYVAVYDTTVNLHSVTWKDWNNQVLHFDYVPSDSLIPTYEDPVSYKDGQKVYFFKEWTPAPVATIMPCTNLEYKATYYSKDLYIVDTIVVHGDTIYEPVEFGTVPNIDKYGINYTECDTIYTFQYWTPAVAVQDTTPVKYVAVYDKQVRTHNVTWYSNGNVVESKNYELDSTIVAPADPTRQTDVNNVYFFKGWDKPFVAGTKMPCKDTTFNAIYRTVPRYYRDTIIRKDGDTLWSDPIEYGTTPDFRKYENTVYHCDSIYEFREWYPSIKMQDTMPVAYTALYDAKVRKHNVTWYDYDNTVLESRDYQYDSLVYEASKPSRSKDQNYVYFFDAWDKPFAAGMTMPCNDTSFKATYKQMPRYYYDTLVRKDDTIPVLVEFGTTPNFSQYETPVVHCDYTYNFNHWEVKGVEGIQKQDTNIIIYVAVYDSTPRTYSVVWIDYDNTTLVSEVKNYGDIVSTPMLVPTRAPEGGNVYFFTGWTPDPADYQAVPCNNLTFKAQYTDTTQYFYDTLIRYNDTIIIPVKYDSTPNLNKYKHTITLCDKILELTGWTPNAMPQDTTAVTYTAQYSETPITHTVTWRNYDHSVYETANYAYNQTVNKPVVDPTRPTDANNVYFFTGWDVEPATVMPCNDLEYVAQFRAKDRYYRDTIYRKHGDTIDTIISEPIEYGKKPNLDKYKTNLSDCDSTYTFIGWTPNPADTIQDTVAITFVANYTVKATLHNVKFKTWNGQVIESTDYAHNDPVTAPADPDRQPDVNSVYFFTGWNPAVEPTMGCDDVVYTATYTEKPRYYRDTIYRQHGDTIDTIISDPIEYGTRPNLYKYETDLSNCDYTYTFTGWTPDPADTLQDTTIITFVANYTVAPTMHNVTFKNWRNQVIANDDYKHGDPVTKPTPDPVRSADQSKVYFFTGWTPAFESTMGCADIVYTPNYYSKDRYYRDTLYRQHGDTIDTIVSDPIEYGTNPDLSKYEESITTCDTLYTFDHWTPAPSDTLQDTVAIIFKAVYNKTRVSRTVTWMDWDRSVIDQKYYYHGDTIDIPVDPTRRPSPNRVYFFAEWTPAIDTVMGCSEAVYTARYNDMPRYYQDTLIIHGDSVVVPQILSEYGKVPDFIDYQKDFNDCENDYFFDHWTPAVEAHGTTCMTYTAVYDTVPRNYTITWNNWNSTPLDYDTLVYGATVNVPADPTRQKDASHVYFFSHWDPTPEATMPCGNQVYTAKFTSAPRYYRDTVVRFGNDTVVPQVMLEYGDDPAIILSQFEDDVFSDCANTYKFRQWNPTPTAQGTVAITYVADYDTIPNKYVATFVDHNGDTLKSDSVLYNAPVVAPADPTRPMDARYTYTFNGWTPAVDSVMPCNNTTYLATYIYAAREYVDTVILHNGQDTAYITMHYGETPDLSQYQDTVVNCQQTEYFHNWIPAPRRQDTIPVKFVAQYGSWFNSYVITWKNGNFIFKVDTLQYGATVHTPTATLEPPTSPDSVYFFDHWSPVPARVMDCHDTVYSAVFRSEARFYDVPVHTKGRVDTISVEYGETPDLSRFESTIVRCDSTFSFIRWTPTPRAQDANPVEYYAVYNEVRNTYNAVWMNGFDTVKVTNVTYGSVIHGPRNIPTPTRPADQDSVYIFSGWNMTPGVTVMDNCGDTVFFAQYTSKSAYIVDTIYLQDTIMFDTVPYDSIAILDRYEGNVVHCDYTYVFDHWTPNPDSTPQPGNPIKFTAVYTPVLNDYYITWVNNGNVVKVDTMHCNDNPYIDDPTMPYDCSTVYTFTGWTPQPVPVTGDATYTATYGESVRKHTVTWVDYDGTTLRVDSVTCNTTPSYDCVIRHGNDAVNYLHNGWYPTLGPVISDTMFYAVYDSVERKVSYDSTLTIIRCMNDTATLPSGAVITVTKDEIIVDTLMLPATRPYASSTCYSGDSLVDVIVYTIDIRHYKDPVNDSNYVIACPGKVILGMSLDLAQVTADIKNSFTGAEDEQTPDWNNSKWEMLDDQGIWQEYLGERILYSEVGDTVYIRYVIPTPCGQIIYDPIVMGCDMSVHGAHADNCPACQEDSVVIAVYDWLLMYEHVAMQAKGYNVTPEKVNWFKIGGDNWDNLDEWVIPYAVDDEYLGTGYYYTINRAFSGTGDYYSIIDVTDAGSKTLPCRGLMRSRRFHYQAASADAPKAEIYPSEVRNSDVIYVIGLQSDVNNEIYVYDMSGKLVNHATVTEDHYEFRAAGAAGTYRVVIISENNKQTLSFIIL